MKKSIIVLLLIIVLGTVLYTYKPLLNTIGADSGWDSSYDSGGSSSSSSSWSSSDYSYGSSSGGSSKDFSEMNWWDFTWLEMVVSIFFFFYSASFFEKRMKKQKRGYWLLGIINGIRWIGAVLLEANVSYKLVIADLILIFVLPIPFVVVSAIKDNIAYRKTQKRRKLEEKKDQEKWQEILKSMGVDKKEVEKELYQIFIDVQNAWMNFDYDKLKELCSDELYNSYKKDLEVLKLKNGQNIMDRFNPVDMYIKKATRKENSLIVEFHLNVIFKDYVINTKTKKVIRGNKRQKMHNVYRLEYQKQDFYVEKCPSCGHEIGPKSNTTCPACGSTIINNTNKFVLVHKERIR